MLWRILWSAPPRWREPSNRQGINPSFSARSSSVFADDGCQLFRPRVSLAHGVQRVTDGLKGDVAIRAFDGGNKCGQAVIRFAAPGWSRHLGRRKAVADTAVHGAGKAGLRPAPRLGPGDKVLYKILDGGKVRLVRCRPVTQLAGLLKGKTDRAREP